MVQTAFLLQLLLVTWSRTAGVEEAKGAFSCFYPPDPGNCDPSKGVVKWFYHLYAAQCQKFLYSNCGGNLNRFNSEAECQSVCRVWMLSATATTPKISSDMARTPIAPLPTPASLISSMSRCLLPKATGTVCEDNSLLSTIEKSRWYWNLKKWECLQFPYQGCQGNTNNFRTKAECLIRCQPADGPTCIGSSKLLKKGVELDDMNSCATLRCPDTHVCQMGAFYAECCPKEDEAEFQCPNGGKPYELSSNEGYLLGDSCEDIRCPSEFSCKAGKIFALCCPQRSSRLPNMDYADLIPSEHFACLEMKDLPPCPAGVYARWYFDRAEQSCQQNNQSCLVSSNNFESLAECRDVCFRRRSQQ